MDTTFMSNYMDILNETLGDDCVYYITDNTPIFNIASLVESYQCDIRDILMESSGGDKRKKFIDWIRTLGKKILSFLSSIIEKVKNYFIKFKEYMARKIEQIMKAKNKKSGSEILDSKEYEHEKRNGRNKKGDSRDDVREEDMPIVRHKDDIAEEKRREEEKKRREEEKKRQEEEKRKLKYEEYKKDYESYCNKEVHKQCNFMGGVSEVNKILDIYQDGFKDYVTDLQKFRDVQSVLKNMGIGFSNGKVTRLDGKKDDDASAYMDREFMPLVHAKTPSVFTNGKFKSDEDINNEYKKIKEIIYGSGEKIKLVDFKGDVIKDSGKYTKEIVDRISKIGENSINVCKLASKNTEIFIKEVEKIAEQIYVAGQGEENRVISDYVKIFVAAYSMCVKKLTAALEEQARSMTRMSSIICSAELDITIIRGELTLMNNAKYRMDSVRESVDDYDGMNWLRDILFE